MKSPLNKHFSESPSRGIRLLNARPAFTLIELMVVIATLAILWAMLLPALCRAKSQTKVTNCMANYRQWAVSVNLYANDNREWLPSFPNVGYGNNIWDVSLQFIPALARYGLTVPLWFCPVRPADWENAMNPQAQGGYIGRPVLTIADLQAYLGKRYGPGEDLLFHSWWVPRQGSGYVFPTHQTGYTNTSPSGYDWPVKTSDTVAALVPFISDICYSGFGTPSTKNINNVNPASAHFFNGKLAGINLGFADGHVAGHLPSQIQARYLGDSGACNWFY